MPTAAKTSRVRRLPGKPVTRPKPSPTFSSPGWLRSVRGIHILELAPFKNLPWLVHGFSTRSGGASVLDSDEHVLNLGFTDWDNREAVLKNRQTFQAAIGATDSTLVPLKQFHSSLVRFYPEAPGEWCKGDASFTNAPGLLLGVQTADCVPILLVDPRKRAVAAIHAGW